jgi:hypothetical protein
LKESELTVLSEKVKMCSELKRPINCEELRKIILGMENFEIIYPGP